MIDFGKFMLEKISRFAFWFVLAGITAYALLPTETDIFRSSYDRLRLTASGFFLHAAAFSVLCFFALAGTRSEKNTPKLMGWIVLYGIALEIIHYFIPYRSFNIFDIVANLTGIIFTNFIYLLRRQAGDHLS